VGASPVRQRADGGGHRLEAHEGLARGREDLRERIAALEADADHTLGVARREGDGLLADLVVVVEGDAHRRARGGVGLKAAALAQQHGAAVAQRAAHHPRAGREGRLELARRQRGARDAVPLAGAHGCPHVRELRTAPYGYARAMRGGIDLGGTKIQAVIVDSDHEVRGQTRVPTPTSSGPSDVAAAMAGALREAADAAGVQTAELDGVGVGSPGDVDGEKGTVTSARNLPDWEGSFPLANELSKALGTRVALGNDVQVATDAEALLGAGRPYRSLLGVFWGTGVGGGIVLDGRPWLGRGAAGEIGHIVVKRDGARCTCGRKGCMEAYAGRGAMELRARARYKNGAKTDLFAIMEDRGRDRLTSGIWARALDRGDKLAVELMDDAIGALGAGVASVQNVLDVNAIVIGGGLGIRLGEPYANRILDAMMPHLFVDSDPPVVQVAALGDLGGAIGASLLVTDPA
jgi:glucokinase